MPVLKSDTKNRSKEVGCHKLHQDIRKDFGRSPAIDIYIRFAAINNRCLAVTYTDDTHLVSVITLWIAHLGEFTLPNSVIGVVYVPIVINIVDKHLTGSVAIKHRRYLGLEIAECETSYYPFVVVETQDAIHPLENAERNMGTQVGRILTKKE